MTLVFASFGVALLVRNVILMGFGPNPFYYSNELQDRGSGWGAGPGDAGPDSSCSA